VDVRGDAGGGGLNIGEGEGHRAGSLRGVGVTCNVAAWSKNFSTRGCA